MKKAQAFLEERKIPVQRVRRVLRSFNRYARTRLLAQDGVQGDLVPDSDVPDEIRQHKTNPWAFFSPPYAGWQRGHWWDSRGYRVGARHFLDHTSGFVGNEINLDNGSAGDRDSAQARYDSQIGFWFRSDRPGLVEAWIEEQCGIGEHYLRLEDEWGWSDSDTFQNNYLMMHVVHPNVRRLSFRRMSWYTGSGSPNLRIRRNEYLRRGSTYWAHLFSDAVVPGDTWVWVRCGTRSLDTSFTNDVEVHSETTFRWFIRSVQIRTTG